MSHISRKSGPMWSLRWVSENSLDGRSEHLMIWHLGKPSCLFRTRSDARAWAREHYGYIVKREDLRREPHGWRMPKPVRVVVSEVES